MRTRWTRSATHGSCWDARCSIKTASTKPKRPSAKQKMHWHNCHPVLTGLPLGSHKAIWRGVAVMTGEQLPSIGAPLRRSRTFGSKALEEVKTVAKKLGKRGLLLALVVVSALLGARGHHITPDGFFDGG